MREKCNKLPIENIYIDTRTLDEHGPFEFTVDCGSVYFGAVYDGDGSLQAIDQYFYSKDYSHDDLEGSYEEHEIVDVEDEDFPVETYMLNKYEDGNEWLRFHAIVPDKINTHYFYEKYIKK